MSLFASFLLESASPGAVYTSFNSTNDRDDTQSEAEPPESTIVMEAEARSVAGPALEGLLAAASNVNDESEDESSYAGQTILSSAPSDTILNIERLGHTDTNPWPATAHPLSVSTSQSCYMGYEEGSHTFPRHDSFASLSFHASGMDSSIALSTDEAVVADQQERLERIRDTASFPSLDYDQSAMMPLHTSTIVLPHRSNGNRLNARRLLNWANESGLDRYLRQRAREFMPLETPPVPRPTTTIRPFRLPPCPPQDNNAMVVIPPALSLQEVGVPSCLPKAFVCPICSSAIVGALTLDCDCGATVCASCWEYRAAVDPAVQEEAGGGRGEEEDAFGLARGLDYQVVVVPSRRPTNPKCPCCSTKVQNPLPCHPLDVAILQLVEGLSSQHKKFQQLFYERLRYWREEVIRRQQEPISTANNGCGSDTAIAQMMQEEEEQMWRQQATAKKKPIGTTIAGAIGFFVAIVASVGIRVLTQRRVDGRFVRQIAQGGGSSKSL